MNKLAPRAAAALALALAVAAGGAAIATATALPLVAAAAPAPATRPAPVATPTTRAKPAPVPVPTTPAEPTPVPTLTTPATEPEPVPVPTTPVAVPAPIAPATRSEAAPTIENCAGAAQPRPTEVTLFCADANDTLTRIDWKHWGKGTATGSAIDVINLCQPSCVAGHDHNYRVHVTVSDLQSTKAGRRYERLTVTFAGKPPKGTSSVEHFKLGAHGPQLA